MITPEYKKLLTDHHKNNPRWGTTAGRFIQQVERITRNTYCFDGLDYGCGKGALKKGYKGQARFGEYDPAIAGKDTIEGRFDIVTCIDVLEHIEPEHINEVLREVLGLAKKVAFLVISTRPAIEVLPDGRNAHLIVESGDWWAAKVSKFSGKGSISIESRNNNEISITIYKKDGAE
tara:strand:+ start:1710 stop:2237 length:528 start_codon:yes stop_codon:yes gene_type:complete